jgi:hypothetical protein
MNDRFRELALEAVNFRLDPDSNAFEAQVSPEDLEYFAELLMQDFIKVLLEWKKEPFPFDEHTAVWILKQHFGVE